MNIENPYPEGSVDWYLFKNLNQKFGLYEDFRGKRGETYDWTLNKVAPYHLIPKCSRCIEDTRRWQNMSPEEREDVKKNVSKYDGDKSGTRFKFKCGKNCLWWQWYLKIREEMD